jgi:hypothetical protein
VGGVSIPIYSKADQRAEALAEMMAGQIRQAERAFYGQLLGLLSISNVNDSIDATTGVETYVNVLVKSDIDLFLLVTTCERFTMRMYHG